MHVTVTSTVNSLRLHINGIHDAEIRLTGSRVRVRGPGQLVVGDASLWSMSPAPAGDCEPTGQGHHTQEGPPSWEHDGRVAMHNICFFQQALDTDGILDHMAGRLLRCGAPGSPNVALLVCPDLPLRMRLSLEARKFGS